MENGNSKNASRGRRAEKPSQLSWRAWKDIGYRVWDEQSKDNLGIVAAGAAFYAFLAVFPAIASAVSIYGLVLDPNQISQQLNAVSGILPQSSTQILHDQLTRLVQQSGGRLSFGLAIGILVTLWSSNKGTKALIQSLNIVYDEQEGRSFLKLNLWSLLLTVCGIFMTLIALSFLVAIPSAVGRLGLPGFIEGLLVYARWPLLAIFVMTVLALVYRYAPDRDQPRWRWVSWGSVIVTILWILGSVLFSYYVANFGNYNKIYGSMGAVIIMMIWFSFSSYLVLLGGEINAEMEHQTEKDTTKGPQRKMGQRDAHVADTVGREMR